MAWTTAGSGGPALDGVAAAPFVALRGDAARCLSQLLPSHPFVTAFARDAPPAALLSHLPPFPLHYRPPLPPTQRQGPLHRKGVLALYHAKLLINDVEKAMVL